MKKIILSILLANAALVAADSDSVYKSGILLPAKGDVIYKRECAECHGADGKKTSFKGSANVKYSEIGGWDKDKLVKDIRDYKGGIKSKDYGPLNRYGYGALVKSATRDLSWDEIDAVADYINGLK